MVGETKQADVFNKKGIRKYHLRDRYEDSPLELDVEFYRDGGVIGDDERSEIERWLFHRGDFQKLYMIDGCGYDGDPENFQTDEDGNALYVNCRFLHPVKIENDSGVVGYRATLEADAPLAWTDDVTQGTSIPSETISGDRISFQGASGTTALNLAVEFEPTQDLHGYDRAWAPGCGKNLFDIEKATLSTGAYGLTMTRSGDVVTVSGTSTNSSTTSLQFAVTTTYANSDLSGKGYVCQAMNVTGTHSIGNAWGFRTESEKSFAISLANVEPQSTVNVSFSISVAVTAQTEYTPYANVCPVPGHTGVDIWHSGKNLFDKSRFSLVNFNLVTDESSSLYGYYYGLLRALGYYSNAFSMANRGFTGTNTSGVITISFDVLEVGSRTSIRFYYTDGTNSGTSYQISAGDSGHFSFHSSESKSCYAVNFQTVGGNSSHVAIKNVQIELGSQETEYEEFLGGPIEASWEDDAGVAYGASADVAAGKLTCDYDGVEQYNPSNAPASLMNFLGDNITPNSADGDVVSFDCELGEVPLAGCVVEIEPIPQDLHGYDYPWPPGGGKNKYDLSRQILTSYNTYLSVSLEQNTDYVFSVDLTINGLYAQYSDADTEPLVTSAQDWTNIANKYNSTFVSFNSGEHKWYRLMTYEVNGVQEKTYQLELGSSPTAYAPFANECPISVWAEAQVWRTGKNMCGESFKHGIFSVSNGQYYSHDGTSTQYVAVGILQIKGGQTYTLSWEDDPNNAAVTATAGFYNGGSFVGYESLNGRKTFTAPENADGVAFDLRSATSITSISQISISKPQLELGSTATAYEPHQGNTYTIDLNGTRYSGTVDLVSGLMTLTKYFKSYSRVDGRSENANGYFWYSTAGAIGIPSIASTSSGLLANRFKAVSNVHEGRPEGEMAFFANGIIRWKEQGSLSITDYRTYLASNPIEICYDLATPLEVQLSPAQVTTLLGENNIWADCGEISVGYYDGDASEIDGLYTSYGTISTGSQVVYHLSNPIERTFTSEQVTILNGVNNMWSDDGDVTAKIVGGIAYVDISVNSDLPEYVWPRVVIQMNSSGGDISIVNLTDDPSRLTSFTGLTANTQVIMDGETNYISGQNYTKFSNKNFVRLKNGENRIMVAGNVESITFKFKNRRYL